MGGPWEKYSAPSSAPSDGPWAKYGTPTPTASQPTASTEESHPLSDFGGNFLSTINPIPGLIQAVSHPIDTVTGAVKAQGAQFGKAWDDLHNTKEMPGLGSRLSSAFGHTVAGLTPLVGPIAADAGEQIGNGDVAGGLGKAAGLLFQAGLPLGKGLASKGLRATAEPIAETAMGVRNVDRAFHKTPGAAILDDTKGVRPDTIRATGQSKLRTLTNEMEGKVDAASTSPIASLDPARDVIDKAQRTAQIQNSSMTARQLEPMAQHLSTDMTSGQPIPSRITPRGILELKRGFGKDFVHNWNPETIKDVKSTATQAYGALNGELDRTAGVGPINQRISSLIPAVNRADTVSRNAGPLQQMLASIPKPTGALAGTIGGAFEGGRLHGPMGAITGGLIGLGLPKLIGSPTVQMIAARSLNGMSKGLPGQMVGRSIQALPLLKRKSDEDEQ